MIQLFKRWYRVFAAVRFWPCFGVKSHCNLPLPAAEFELSKVKLSHVCHSLIQTAATEVVVVNSKWYWNECHHQRFDHNFSEWKASFATEFRLKCSTWGIQYSLNWSVRSEIGYINLIAWFLGNLTHLNLVLTNFLKPKLINTVIVLKLIFLLKTFKLERVLSLMKVTLHNAYAVY